MKLDTDRVAVELSGRRIVDDVSLKIAPGEVVGLIGPNGSGKSTLLRAVYRMLRPSAGVIRLNDDDVWQLSARESARRTGVVVQETPGDFEFTVAEVVQMGRTPHKGVLASDTQEDARIVAGALRRVQMAHFADRQFSTLSGGEKQRVLVARALAQQPRFLVLDEPTNHLDIHYQLELLELVRNLGITTLITLHDLNLAAAYCQRLYLLRAGRIVASGLPAQVLTPERLREVFMVEVIVGQHPATGALQLAFVPRPPQPAED
ncbi:MAG: ABC transporter ATP-binding protein [Chloroflexi bacterium OHK40]